MDPQRRPPWSPVFNAECAVAAHSRLTLAMQMRRLLNLPDIRQAELRRQYPWLRAVAWNEDDLPRHLNAMAVTVFDHWLTRDEANELLENVSPEVQENRTARHAKFCALLIAATPVLSFAFRRRAHDRTTFRKFNSSEALSKYCTPNGGQTLRHRHFQVVLPELSCAFFEGWDDTHHFYFNNLASIDLIQEWAGQCGLHLLKHG